MEKGKGRAEQVDPIEGQVEVDELPDEPLNDFSSLSPLPDPILASASTPKIKIKISRDVNTLDRRSKVHFEDKKPTIVTLEESDSEPEVIELSEPEFNCAFTTERQNVISRPISFSPDVKDFRLFLYAVAEAFGERPSDQDLVWKNNRMLRGDKWHELKTEVDFEEIIEEGRAYFKSDISKRNSALVKNQADAAKAKKKGTVHVPKDIPKIIDYVVNIRDRNQEQSHKASTKKASLYAR
ncbi:hypothetical protein FS749_009010 [Ceratobasidium sp. UAMH 11750]|nr:hypothetical protein FS749_009010 [Ceratobasidium sp. UAMH 11750]